VTASGTRALKIGITCYPTYGGSGALATELGLDLARRGHEVHFIAYASPFRLRGYHERVWFHEVDTRIAKYPLFEYFPYTLALASKQHEVALRERLDLMHCHYAIPHATTAWLAREMLGRELPLKVITTLHGTDITLVGQEASFYTITKFSIERSDAVTAVSDFLRDETYRAFGCMGCDIRTIPNFVNLAEYHPGPREIAHLAPPGHKVLSHVSNFREVKRVKDVVRVFARVRLAVPSTLVMVGDGPDRPEAEQEARTLGVAEDVRFLGRLDSVAPILRSSDLFVLPSQTESFGLAALEAMACGAPVVASKVGGLPEVIEDGVSGILEPPGSVEAMGRRAAELLRDEPRHALMREAAIATSLRYSADNIVPMYEALYHEVCR
jgi:N-acetyl-alpha-D-glucosaminyl L-malate synthase BshA